MAHCIFDVRDAEIEPAVKLSPTHFVSAEPSANRLETKCCQSFDKQIFKIFIFLKRFFRILLKTTSSPAEADTDIL